MIGSCYYGNEPSGFIKGGKFLDQLCDCQPHTEDSSPWGYL